MCLHTGLTMKLQQLRRFLTYANQIRSVVVENGVTSIGETRFMAAIV